MTSEFLYIIRSSNLESGNYDNLNIRLNGLPTQFTKFKATVVMFDIATSEITQANGVFNTSFIELRVDGMDVLNGYDTLRKRLTTVAFYNLTNNAHQSNYSFEVGNFNARTINFQLFNDLGVLMTENAHWTLVLKMQGLE